MITVNFEDGSKMVFRDGLHHYLDNDWVYITDDEAILAAFHFKRIKAILFDKAGENSDGD